MCIREEVQRQNSSQRYTYREVQKGLNGEEEEVVQKGLNNSLEKNSKRCEEVQNGVKKFKMVK